LEIPSLPPLPPLPVYGLDHLRCLDIAIKHLVTTKAISPEGQEVRENLCKELEVGLRHTHGIGACFPVLGSIQVPSCISHWEARVFGFDPCLRQSPLPSPPLPSSSATHVQRYAFSQYYKSYSYHPNPNPIPSQTLLFSPFS